MEMLSMLTVLTEFGATGSIAGMRPLASFPEVTAVLGPPEKSGRISDDQPWPQWFQYGDMSVEVCRCRIINRVSVRTWYESVRIPTGRPGEFHTFEAAPTCPQLSAAFSAAGVPWQRVKQTHSLPQFTIETDIAGLPGVTVAFTFTTGETPDAPPLHSAHAVEFAHECPEDSAPVPG
ncbi:hypothetical protein [Kitasatospora cystarginea]